MAVERLTPREREVLALVAQHLTNVEIAERLVIAESTVASHVHAIIRKMRVGNRRAAARVYLAGEALADRGNP